MKTKIIPFCLEMAKKIQAEEIEGKIVQANGLPADILAYNINGSNLAVRFTREDGSEGVDEYQPNGKVQAEWCEGAEDFALVLEVPCIHIESKREPQFKPFDKVLVKPYDMSESMEDVNCWRVDVFSHIDKCTGDYVCIGGLANPKYILPYEGNEHLVGTTDKPKEN